MKHLLAALLVLTLFASCSKESELGPPIDYTVQNEKDINEFLTNNKLTAQRTDTGLYYIINEAGDGTQPNSSSTVTVAYKGTFINGQIFDQSTNAGITISLNNVIKGWKEGIPLFKTGGSGLLLIPSHLGYGSYDYKSIPGGSVLIFEIKLIEVKPN
ncbi:FKBP-type peptidyl-prolyl cis-trans isomerase [Flavobacterium eburneipallidum]|uniref:FKBP-type peptidyl-prolyl cis-trans isomerase n=1 Tax=Flavobacterium eburneipallidum TaxID=3003263 RepID=UPI0022ABF803|nr:FKBP-type peptidyl-prolyl cis-trans isomerase [Flavobacterium eburneipallidum]